MPWCYFNISKPGPEPEMQMRCGNMNTLNERDFRLVKAGASFNPYDRTGDHDFFGDYLTGSKTTFKDAGVYKISFHYSSNSANIDDFMGDSPSKYNKLDTAIIFPLFQQTAKIDVTSNEIEFRVE